MVNPLAHFIKSDKYSNDKRRVLDKEYKKYLKKNYPNSKKVTCPKCGSKEQYSHYNYCDQCGNSLKK